MESSYAIGANWWYSLVIILVVYAQIERHHMRRDHVIRFKEAVVWSAIYVALGLLYAVPIFIWIGSQAGSEYLAAFFTEKALSLDNLFVFGLVFAAFKVPKELERRVLNYGIVGAIIFRLIFIVAGLELLERFVWISVVFGLILLRASWHAYKDAVGKASEITITETKTWRIVSKVVPFSHEFKGHALITKVGGKRVLTMLAVVITMIELTDILFAVDSVPAVLAISNNRFIAYSSNIFAILGLRALYFVYARVADRFWALKWGISMILGWISIKLILTPFHIEISHLLNLGIILGILVFSIMLSNLYDQPQRHIK